MREWGTRYVRDKKKKKGDVGMEKEKERGGGEVSEFFSTLYEFFNPVPVVPAVPTNAFVPVVLPARFVPVAFVPALSVPVAFVPCITTRSTA